jgi:hypothetical protein
VTLDVFGHALRESSPWPQDVIGLYAGAHTVAAMKRTNRDKDWPFVTSLGVRMVEADDEQGWLHIFDAGTLLETMAQYECPEEIAAARPALELAKKRDARLAGALNAERKLWEELDRRRLHILERHLRAYVSAVRRARMAKTLPLQQEHALRVECAGRHLPENPLAAHGLQKYVDEARATLIESALVPENMLSWLPDVMIYFDWLNT